MRTWMRILWGSVLASLAYGVVLLGVIVWGLGRQGIRGEMGWLVVWFYGVLGLVLAVILCLLALMTWASRPATRRLLFVSLAALVVNILSFCGQHIVGGIMVWWYESHNEVKTSGLHDAIMADDANAVAAVLDRNGGLLTAMYREMTPLQLGVNFSKWSAAETLLQRGASANDVDRSGWPLLHTPAAGGSPEGVRLLLRYGADVNGRDTEGGTALHWSAFAMKKGERGMAVITELVKHGANVTAVDNRGRTPEDMAEQFGLGRERFRQAAGRIAPPSGPAGSVGHDQ